MFKSLIRAAAIGYGIYLVGKVGEAIGYCKGAVATVRAAGHDPEWAATCAQRWDDLDKEWKEFKNKKA